MKSSAITYGNPEPGETSARKDSGQYDYMDTDSIGGVVVELIHAYK